MRYICYHRNAIQNRMIEFLFFFVVLFFIAALFYRESKTEFEILQLEADRLEELPDLYSEKQPIVLRGLSFPPLGTYSELRKRPQILQMGSTPTLTLDALLHSPDLATFELLPLRRCLRPAPSTSSAWSACSRWPWAWR